MRRFDTKFTDGMRRFIKISELTNIMVTLIKDSDLDELVPACSIQIPKSDRARLNKIKGENDLKTFSDAIKFLIKEYTNKKKK